MPQQPACMCVAESQTCKCAVHMPLMPAPPDTSFKHCCAMLSTAADTPTATNSHNSNACSAQSMLLQSPQQASMHHNAAHSMHAYGCSSAWHSPRASLDACKSTAQHHFQLKLNRRPPLASVAHPLFRQTTRAAGNMPSSFSALVYKPTSSSSSPS